jgi:hypothetical protein
MYTWWLADKDPATFCMSYPSPAAAVIRMVTNLRAVLPLTVVHNLRSAGVRKGNSWTGPEGSRRLTLPDFKTVGI